MDGFIWLNDERRDGDGRLWPDASLDGFWVTDAQVLRPDTLLSRGIGSQLWTVEFEGQAVPTVDGAGGKARLFAQIPGWSVSTAGELRLQLFQLVRAGLARAIVAAQDESRQDPFERDVILDLVAAGRKISGARGPSELKPVMPQLNDLGQRLWPPDRKRGMFSKKVDTSRVYENMRAAMESALEAANESVEATLDMDVIHGVNRMLTVLGKLTRAETRFVEMLRIQALTDQAQIDSELEQARTRIRAIRDLDVHEPGEGAEDAGADGLGASQSVFLQQATGAPVTMPKAAPKANESSQGSEFPPTFIEAATWLQNRLQLVSRTS